MFGKNLPDHAARAEWLRALAEDRAAAQIVPDLVVPPHERKILVDLEENDCRWIHGDPKKPDHTFCNRKKVAGLPYCDFHAKRAFAPPSFRGPRIGRDNPIVDKFTPVLKEFDAMERA